ncbi:hypothetical protein B9Z19DRAFT_1081508 [Tuber borchii]|uniref:Uncharacterized protein n=1 Tax=Tuber borchii TaxID=42251 RepID=A0A2T6ZVP7_TUBBO|nr:hypothetical protein B9Z19DRAFT_1081508 [Tuber borchii]
MILCLTMENNLTTKPPTPLGPFSLFLSPTPYSPARFQKPQYHKAQPTPSFNPTKQSIHTQLHHNHQHGRAEHSTKPPPPRQGPHRVTHHDQLQ